MNQLALVFTPPNYDTAKARDLRDGAMSNAADSAGDAFKAAVRKAVEQLAATGEVFSSDHVRALVEVQGYKPHDWRAMGGTISAAVKVLGLKNLGFMDTDHETSHGRPKRHYQGIKNGKL